MKFIEQYETQPSNVLHSIAYNKLGDLAKGSEKTLAKEIHLDMGQQQTQIKYLIATHNNIPYDPRGIDSHRESKIEIILKPVSKNTFFYYTLYLKTRNSLYMTRTQRSYING